MKTGKQNSTQQSQGGSSSTTATQSDRPVSYGRVPLSEQEIEAINVRMSVCFPIYIIFIIFIMCIYISVTGLTSDVIILHIFILDNN